MEPKRSRLVDVIGVQSRAGAPTADTQIADTLTRELQVGMGRGFLRSASVAAAITLVLSTVSITQSEAQNAQFKGWAAVSRELSTRLAAPGASLDLQKFV